MICPLDRASKYGTSADKQSCLAFRISRVNLHTLIQSARLSITKQKRKPRKRFPFLWCGRQELKTYDDTKKALVSKAFLLLNANMDAKIFWGRYDIADLI